MIEPELRTKIRRLYFAEHWRVGTIATELGVRHDAVRRAIEADRFVRPDALVKPSMLDPYKAFIAETLEHHPRLRATRLFEMARDRSYTGSVVQLRQYVGTVRRGRARRRSCGSPRCPGSRPRWTGATSARSESGTPSGRSRAS